MHNYNWFSVFNTSPLKNITKITFFSFQSIYIIINNKIKKQIINKGVINKKKGFNCKI